MKDNNYGIPESVLNAEIEKIKAENRKQRQDDVHPIIGIIGIIIFWPIALIGFFLSGRK